MFDDLVKKGKHLEQAGRSRLEQVLGRVREARTDARQAIGRVVAPIDEAASGALHKVGVPTRKEIQALTRRVEELTHRDLSEQQDRFDMQLAIGVLRALALDRGPNEGADKGSDEGAGKGADGSDNGQDAPPGSTAPGSMPPGSIGPESGPGTLS